MKALKITSLLLFIIWCGGFFAFIYKVNNISNNNRSMTESIVVFGGKRQNLYTASQLLKLGYAPLAFITGDKPKSHYMNFFKAQKLAPEQFIFDENISKGDKNYAEEVAQFLYKYQFQSLRLVADADQMPRALKELSYTLPDIIVIPHPISIKNKNYTKIFVEYCKYTAILVTYSLGFQNAFNLSYS